MVQFFIFSAKPENSANRLGYHAFFVCANDADRNPAGWRGNHGLIRRVSFFFECDSKEFQPIANPSADHWRILSDAAREHQRVQSA
jgi:hypothetical protein